MDAVLLKSGAFIGIRDFEQQSSDWREEHKSELQCPECRASAVYVRRSRDGRASCFRAKHVAGCAEARTVEVEEGRLTDGGAQRHNKGAATRLILSGVLEPIQAGAKVIQTGNAAVAKRGQRHNGDVVPSSNQRTLHLLTLLKRLVRNARYLQGPTDVLDLRPAGSGLGKELIRKFTGISAPDIGKTKIVWGSVETIRSQNGTAYVNAGNSGRNPFAIALPDPLREVLAKSESWSEAVAAAQYNTFEVFAIAVGRVEASYGSDYRMNISDLGRFEYFVGAITR